MKFWFRNDYSFGAHPKVLEAVCAANLEGNIGYGDDKYTDRKLYFSRTTQEFTLGLRRATMEKHANSPYKQDMRKTWDMSRYRSEMRLQQQSEGSHRKSDE